MTFQGFLKNLGLVFLLLFTMSQSFCKCQNSSMSFNGSSSIAGSGSASDLDGDPSVFLTPSFYKDKDGFHKQLRVPPGNPTIYDLKAVQHSNIYPVNKTNCTGANSSAIGTIAIYNGMVCVVEVSFLRCCPLPQGKIVHLECHPVCFNHSIAPELGALQLAHVMLQHESGPKRSIHRMYFLSDHNHHHTKKVLFHSGHALVVMFPFVGKSGHCCSTSIFGLSMEIHHFLEHGFCSESGTMCQNVKKGTVILHNTTHTILANGHITFSAILALICFFHAPMSALNLLFTCPSPEGAKYKIFFFYLFCFVYFTLMWVLSPIVRILLIMSNSKINENVSYKIWRWVSCPPDFLVMSPLEVNDMEVKLETAINNMPGLNFWYDNRDKARECYNVSVSKIIPTQQATPESPSPQPPSASPAHAPGAEEDQSGNTMHIPEEDLNKNNSSDHHINNNIIMSNNNRNNSENSTNKIKAASQEGNLEEGEEDGMSKNSKEVGKHDNNQNAEKEVTDDDSDTSEDKTKERVHSKITPHFTFKAFLETCKVDFNPFNKKRTRSTISSSAKTFSLCFFIMNLIFFSPTFVNAQFNAGIVQDLRTIIPASGAFQWGTFEYQGPTSTDEVTYNINLDPRELTSSSSYTIFTNAKLIYAQNAGPGHSFGGIDNNKANVVNPCFTFCYSFLDNFEGQRCYNKCYGAEATFSATMMCDTDILFTDRHWKVVGIVGIGVCKTSNIEYAACLVVEADAEPQKALVYFGQFPRGTITASLVLSTPTANLTNPGTVFSDVDMNARCVCYFIEKNKINYQVSCVKQNIFLLPGQAMSPNMAGNFQFPTSLFTTDDPRLEFHITNNGFELLKGVCVYQELPVTWCATAAQTSCYTINKVVDNSRAIALYDYDYDTIEMELISGAIFSQTTQLTSNINNNYYNFSISAARLKEMERLPVTNPDLNIQRHFNQFFRFTKTFMQHPDDDGTTNNPYYTESYIGNAPDEGDEFDTVSFLTYRGLPYGKISNDVQAISVYSSFANTPVSGKITTRNGEAVMMFDDGVDRSEQTVDISVSVAETADMSWASATQVIANGIFIYNSVHIRRKLRPNPKIATQTYLAIPPILSQIIQIAPYFSDNNNHQNNNESQNKPSANIDNRNNSADNNSTSNISSAGNPSARLSPSTQYLGWGQTTFSESVGSYSHILNNTLVHAHCTDLRATSQLITCGSFRKIGPCPSFDYMFPEICKLHSNFVYEAERGDGKVLVSHLANQSVFTDSRHINFLAPMWKNVTIVKPPEHHWWDAFGSIGGVLAGVFTGIAGLAVAAFTAVSHLLGDLPAFMPGGSCFSCAKVCNLIRDTLLLVFTCGLAYCCYKSKGVVDDVLPVKQAQQLPAPSEIGSESHRRKKYKTITVTDSDNDKTNEVSR